MAKVICITLVAAGLFVGAPSVAHAGPWVVQVSGIVYGDTDFGLPDQNGLFGPPGSSLAGLPYTTTIITDPSLNTFHQQLTPGLHSTYGGNAFGGCCAAPYAITTTVNGITYSQTDANPFRNYSYLLNPLSINDVSTTLQDQVYQDIGSAGCFSSYGECTFAYVLAYSLSAPFVPTLNFDQSIDFSAGLDPGANSYFVYRNGPTQSGTQQNYTGFHGTITRLLVNPVEIPEPSTWALVLMGLAGIGVMAQRRLGTVRAG